MASSKKKGGRQDDFDWDSDLDFDIPEMGSDDPSGLTDDRKPITKGIKSAIGGFGKTFATEARLRKTLTNSLPKEYAEPISKAFEIKNAGKDLYHITSGEISKTVRESKRSVNRIARNLESSIPKGMYEKIMRMTSEDSSDSHTPTKEEIEQGTIDSAIANMMAETAKVDDENRKQDNARQIVQENIDKKRHEDMTSILGSVDQSLIAMSTYQQNVGTNFMKKSIEMQYRSYFVQNNMLQLQTRYFQMFKDDLAAITKNTGLPDYVKKATKEALFERMREKTFDALAGSLANRRNNFISGIVKKSGDKIKEVGSNIRDAGSQVFDTMEGITGMMGSGMGPSGSEMFGDVVGSFGGGKLQDYLAKKIYEQTQNNAGVIKNGNKLALIAQNLPQWLNEQARNGKYANKIPEFMKDIIRPDGEKSSVELSSELDLENATQFSEKNSRSLNVVIPELLEQIRHEVHILRTGDASAKPRAYDHETGQFISKDDHRAKLSTQIVSKETTTRTQLEVQEIFKRVDPNGTKFDPATRDKIAAELYEANKDNKMFDRKGMINASTNTEFADAVRDHIGADATGIKEKRLSSLFGGLGARNKEVGETVQELYKAGRMGDLVEMGLVNPKTGKIDLKRIREMELGKTATEDPQLPPRPPTPSNPTGPVASALGNVFNGGRVKAFAKGGVFTNTVVDEPTTFPMPEGKVGLMGEAGPEAIVPLSRDESGRLGIKSDGKSSKVILEIRDILKRIEEKGLGGGMTREMLEEFFGNKASKLGEFAKGIGGKAWGLTKGGFGKSWDLAGGAFKLAGKGLGAGANWLTEKKQKFDLYVGEEVEPRLSKAKLEAGKYIDEATGKVIKTFEDITGAVRDTETGAIVLTKEELKKAVLKNWESGKQVAVSGLAWGKKAIESIYGHSKAAVGRLFGGAKSIYGVGYNTLKMAYDKLTDGPMDVYVKDKYDTPVLLKRTMAAGLYFNKDDFSVITKVSEIKGAVVDNDENVVLTKEELAQGLYDKDGKEIKTGFDKIAQMAGNSIKKAMGFHKAIIDKGLEMGKGAIDWVSNLFGGKSPFAATSKKTNDILTAIYNLLNARMPGDKSPELSDIVGEDNTSGTEGESKWSKFVSKVKGKKDELKEKLDPKAKEIKDKVQPKVDELKDKAKAKTNEIKDKIKELKETPREELKQKVTEKIQEAKDKAAEKLKEAEGYGKDQWTKGKTAAKEKLTELNEKHGDPKGKFSKAAEKFTDKAKEKGTEGWQKLYNLISERFPKPEKKHFDDLDGDGVREGSIDDLRAKRKAEGKEEDEKKAGAFGGKPGGMGAFSALADFFKKKKKKEDEEKEEEGGIGLDDVADAMGGDGADNSRDAKRKRRLARMRANRPQGRLGKLASGAGKLLKKIPGAGTVGKLATKFGGSMAGRGLAMAGRGALAMGGGALSMLGGNVLGGAGRLALGLGSTVLGGGLSSAGILSGGIGLLGSALGMAGTAVSAILASPVLVPALIAAGVAGAGYLAYKWLTKPDPQAIEKVRMVQYGWRSDDIDAYKKIKSIEQKVEGAVVFSGEKAEFDPKRLNIQEMMKVFDLDPNKQEDAKKFIDWFAGRFRPVYLNHAALIKTTNSPKKLADVDDNKAEFKTSYLDQCLFPGEHYSVYANPQKDKNTLFTSQGTVERQIAASKEEVKSKGDSKPEDKKPLNASPTLAAAAAAKVAADKAKLDAEKKLDQDKDADATKANRGGSGNEEAGKQRRLAALAGGAASTLGPDGKPDMANPVNAPSGPNGEPARPKSRTGVKPKNGDAAVVKAAMIKKMPQFGITSINQKAALLGNVEHESGFQPISENLNYKAATLMKLWPKRFPTMEDANKVASQGPEGIANSIYGNRMGNTGPTDGWDYRGRGPIQITGKSNYAAISKIMGKDIVNDPDKLITDPETSAESALAYWRLNPKLGKAADEGKFDQVRRMINGGTIGAEDANNKVMEYLEQLKTGNSVPEEAAPKLVASPRPTPAPIEDNPNLGPAPESFKAPRTVPSPRPSYDPSAPAPSAPVASVRSAASDPYYQKESKVNTGDSIGILNKSYDELGKHTGLLTRIADSLDKLPENLAAVMAGKEPESKPTPAPVASKPPAPAQPMATASVGFKRALAGV